MTRHPKITAKNYNAVYDYYQESRLKPHLSNSIYRTSNALYQPNVFIGDETRELIRAELTLGKGALLAMNHPSHHDPFVGASGVYQSGIPELTDSMAFAKDSLFRGPTRPLFEYTGCVPVFRHKSYPELDRRTFGLATGRLLDLASSRLRDGQTVTILPEGTTSRPEALTHLELQDIKSGIARVALAASDEHSLIVPAAIAYRHSRRSGRVAPRHAIVAFGDPITEYEPSSRGIREQVLVAIQTQLERANDLLSSQ